MFNREKSDTRTVPMMPVREMVIFPQQMSPFIVGREGSVRALEEALASDKKIFLATQHDASIDDPKPEEIYGVGTIADIVQSVKLPDGNVRVLVEGFERAKVIDVSGSEGFFRARVRTDSREIRAVHRNRTARSARHHGIRAVRKTLAGRELRHCHRRSQAG